LAAKQLKLTSSWTVLSKTAQDLLVSTTEVYWRHVVFIVSINSNSGLLCIASTDTSPSLVAPSIDHPLFIMLKTTDRDTSSNNPPQHIILVDIGSRKKGEFERRTAIFEGAFRAWSYLGRLDPTDLFMGEGSPHKTATELDPLDHHHPRSGGRRVSSSSIKTEYPCENLPRDGLAHPFVQAILSPWLGGHADADVRKRGLDTLRTWWQHRRQGMSRTAVQALRKMTHVVDGYTRLFFRFAHCLVVHAQATPPPTLQAKMKELQQQQQGPAANDTTSSGRKEEEHSLDTVQADVANPNLTPLEKLHSVQQRIRGSSLASSNAAPPRTAVLVNLREMCVPGPIDFLHQVVESIDRHNRAMASAAAEAVVVRRRSVVGGGTTTMRPQQQPTQGHQDPESHNTTPVVYCSNGGDAMIALTVDGIVCAHCVKIVETVLRGCSNNGANGTSNNNNKSPIDGLVDAVADHRDIISTVLVKIDQPHHAPRIAYEAVRNLRLVGYEAVAKTMNTTTRVVKSTTEERAASTEPEVLVATAFAACSTTCTTTTSEPPFTFDWTVPCTCPDHGTFLLRDDCPRHSQMHHARILDAFAAREGQVHDYLLRMEAAGDGAGRPGCDGPHPILPNTNAAPNQPFLMEAELSSVLVPPPARNEPVLGAFDATQQPLERPIAISSRDISLSLYSIGTNKSARSGPVLGAFDATQQPLERPIPIRSRDISLSLYSIGTNKSARNEPVLGAFDATQQPLERPIPISSRDISLSLYSIGTNKSYRRLRESILGRATNRDDKRDDAVGRRRSSRRQSTLTFGSSMSGLLDLDWENLDDDIDLDA
jgi:hypothetical protein